METPRLRLREMTDEDWPDLAEIMRDPEVMTAYEGPYTDEGVTHWLRRQQERYARSGIGLWAVILRETGAFIGQCGLTWQMADSETLLEIGYLFKRRYWHHGYATEAAVACKEYAFDVLQAQSVCSIIRDTNLASMAVARRNGMQPGNTFIKMFRGLRMPHVIFSVDNPVALAYNEKA